jgi:hypothetical protein
LSPSSLITSHTSSTLFRRSAHHTFATPDIRCVCGVRGVRGVRVPCRTLQVACEGKVAEFAVRLLMRGSMVVSEQNQVAHGG